MTIVDRRVVVCLGSGGVGKTTLAACLGIAAAQRGERAVVLTIDPARRLATTLGLASEGAIGNEPTLVPGPWPGRLYAAMLDPAATIASVLRRHGTAEQADRLLANPLFTTIVGSLSGSSEYLAAEQLHQLHHDQRFDRVLIDTPPSHHAIDFLDSPGRLTRFVDNRLYRAVFAPRRGLLRPASSAAQLVFRLTARLVGTDLVDNVIDLFRDLDGLDDGFRRRAAETAELMASPACGYLLITTPRYEPMREAGWIRDSLHRRGRVLDLVVVNRLTPFGRGPAAPTGRDGQGEGRRALEENWRQLAQLAAVEDELIERLRADFTSAVPTILLDECAEPVRSVHDLAALAGRLEATRALQLDGEPSR